MIMIIISPDEKKKTKPSHIIIFPGLCTGYLPQCFFLFSLANSIFLILAPFVFHSNFFKGFKTNAAFFVHRVSPWLAFSLRCVQCKTPTKNYNNTTKNVMALEMLPSAPFRH
jgi:hypothetical protein